MELIVSVQKYFLRLQNSCFLGDLKKTSDLGTTGDFLKYVEVRGLVKIYIFQGWPINEYSFLSIYFIGLNWFFLYQIQQLKFIKKEYFLKFQEKWMKMFEENAFQFLE